MKVSIIVPIYNAEATAGRSLESIKAQSFRDFEVVFVDDCSSDGSRAVMQKFAEESGIPAKIVCHEANRGVAAARNTGLDAAEGEYVCWLDADDTMEPDALAKAVEVAGAAGADIAGWDWTLGFEKNGRYMRQADYSSPLDALKALMGGTMRWNLWLFLIRRSLLVDNNIRFIEGADMGEDMMVMLKAFCKAGRVVQLHEALYRYNAVSSSSISRQFSDRRRSEVGINVAEAEKAVLASQYGSELSEYINHLKLYIKLPLLISSERSNYELWYDWFPEANGYAMSNKALPLRTRLLQKMAAAKCWCGVRMYYLLVYKLVYGLIFK